jgi:hypothetical protein
MKKGGEDIELEIKSIGSLVLWSHFPEIVRKLEEPILAMVLIYISN